MKALQLMFVALLASAACNKPKEEPAADSYGGMTMDSGAMRGMSGMGKSGMMPMMQAHTDSMTRMSRDQMSAMMPTHERMMSQMMDQMGGEMRQMKMAETPAWAALADSVRQDLAELPSLKGQALSSRMEAHAGRVQRLIAAHVGMMKGMR
ncbi:MAG: hypothetical protein ACREMZ_13650 [Gemmatimonadales bacterium]